MAKHIKKKHRLGETYIKKSSKNMFSEKIGLRACFCIADFGSFGWGKTGSKKSRREVNGLCQRILHVFSHDCFITFRPEIVEIVGDSYDPKRSPLKSVAFKGMLEHARTGSSTFIGTSIIKKQRN